MRGPRSSNAAGSVGGGPSTAATSTSGGPPVTYSGSALGGFTSQATVLSSAGSTIAFSPGMSLWVIWQANSITADGLNDILLGCSSGTWAGGKGWELVLSNAKLALLSSGGNFIIMSPTPGANGIFCCCFVWTLSNGHFAMSVNGLALATGVSGNGNATLLQSAAVDSSCASTIGSANGFTGVAPTTARIIAAATWNREASATEAQRYTFTSGSRYALRSGVLGDAACQFDWNAGRDWDGAASTIVTRGAAPVTFNVVAAHKPTLTIVRETRVPAANTYYFDGHLAVPRVDSNGYHYTYRHPFERLKATTDALYVSLDAYSSLLGQSVGDDASIGHYVNGAFVAETLFDATYVANSPVNLNLQLGAGSAKAVEIWEGPQILHTITQPVHDGTFVQAVRLPAFMADGSTSANSGMVMPSTRPQKRLLLLGDSILLGYFSTKQTQQSVTALIRADFPTSGTGAVTCFCVGGLQLNDIAKPSVLAATLALISAELDGTVSNTIWIAIGSNDAGNQGVINAGAFQTYYTALLNGLYALGKTGIDVRAQSMIQNLPSEPPGKQAYRTAIANAVTAANTAAGVTFVTYVEGAAGAIVPDGDIYSDGIHLTTTGDADYKAFIKTTLGY